MPIYQSQLYQRLFFDYVQLSFLTAQLLFVSANRLGLTRALWFNQTRTGCSKLGYSGAKSNIVVHLHSLVQLPLPASNLRLSSREEFAT